MIFNIFSEISEILRYKKRVQFLSHVSQFQFILVDPSSFNGSSFIIVTVKDQSSVMALGNTMNHRKWSNLYVRHKSVYFF